MPSSKPALISVGAVQSLVGRWRNCEHKCAPAYLEPVRCLAFFERKSAAPLLARPRMSSQFMAVHSKESSVALMGAVLEGSVSGDDAWCKREPSRHRREDALLAAKLVEASQHHRRFPRLFDATPSTSGLFCSLYLSFSRCASRGW